MINIKSEQIRYLELEDDNDDVAPAWVAFSLGGFFLVFSIIVYGLLLVAERRLQMQEEPAVAPQQSGNPAIISSILQMPFEAIADMAPVPSAFDKWIEQRGETLRHFILSSLVFFAIPNLIFLGGLQLNFDITLFAVVMGLAGLLTVSIMLTVLYYSNPENHCVFQPEDFVWVAFNKYEHLGLPLLHIVLLGIGQLTLLSLYVWGLYEAGQPQFDNIRKYSYYMLGILMQIVYGYDQGIWDTVHEHYVFWVGALQAHRLGNEWEYEKMDGTMVKFNVKTDKAVMPRFLFSTLVNTMGLFTIMMGLPIQVATQSDPLDFVLNVVAALYIVEWDDLDSSEQAKFRCVKVYSKQQEPNTDHESLVDTNTSGQSYDKDSHRNKYDKINCSCEGEIALLKEQLAIMAQKISDLETKSNNNECDVEFVLNDSTVQHKDSKRPSQGLRKPE